MKKFGLSVLYTWHGLLPILGAFLVLEMLPMPSMLGVDITITAFVLLNVLKFKRERGEERAKRRV
jgi:hypothetical protein